MGRRVAIVGVGNVMVDIANYCAHFTRLRRDHRDRAARARSRRPTTTASSRTSRTPSTATLYRAGDRAHPAAAARPPGQNPDELLPRSRPSPSRRRGPARACASASSPRPSAWWRRAAAWSGSRSRRTGSSARATGSSRSAPARSRVIPATPWCSRWATAWTRTRACRTRTGSISPCPARIPPPPTRSGIPRPSGRGRACSWSAGPGGPATASWAARGSTPRPASSTSLGWLADRPKRPRAEAERVVAVGARHARRARGAAVVTYPDVQRIEAAEKARAAADERRGVQVRAATARCSDAIRELGARPRPEQRAGAAPRATP